VNIADIEGGENLAAAVSQVKLQFNDTNYYSIDQVHGNFFFPSSAGTLFSACS
jgi:hypothetical protein